MTSPAPLLVLAALLALTLPAGAEAPSFDCRTAGTPVEKAICRSASLSGLDAEMARAYGRAMKALSAGSQKVLKQQQQLFLRARDMAFGRPDEDLAARLGEQVAFLKSIDPSPRSDLVGAWRNTLGTVLVKAEAGGLGAAIETAEPVNARWLCNVEGAVSRGSGAAATLAVDPGFAPGWSVTLTAHDGHLTVATVPPAKGEGFVQAPFCGNNGMVDGDYLPVRP